MSTTDHPARHAHRRLKPKSGPGDARGVGPDRGPAHAPWLRRAGCAALALATGLGAAWRMGWLGGLLDLRGLSGDGVPDISPNLPPPYPIADGLFRRARPHRLAPRLKVAAG